MPERLIIESEQVESGLPELDAPEASGWDRCLALLAACFALIVGSILAVIWI
jgi:hypothetical protein